MSGKTVQLVNKIQSSNSQLHPSSAKFIRFLNYLTRGNKTVTRYIERDFQTNSMPTANVTSFKFETENERVATTYFILFRFFPFKN